MIRRHIRLADRNPCWLLISQIEHARLSGLLAERCIDPLGPSGCGSEVRNELLAAIIHHDDGWAAEDAEPRLDDAGQPLSFREWPLCESIPIWTASIESAAKCGDLAAWTVAGHFLALLDSSAKPSGGESAGSWRAEMNQRRAEWLVRWCAGDPQRRSEELAAASLAWLQLMDVTSLWLCNVCPGGGERVTQWPDGYRFGDWEFAPDLSCAPSANAQRCRATIKPWPFDVDELAIHATGSIVPVGEYRSPGELTRAMTRHEVRWLLTPAS